MARFPDGHPPIPGPLPNPLPGRLASGRTPPLRKVNPSFFAVPHQLGNRPPEGDASGGRLRLDPRSVPPACRALEVLLDGPSHRCHNEVHLLFGGEVDIEANLIDVIILKSPRSNKLFNGDTGY